MIFYKPKFNAILSQEYSSTKGFYYYLIYIYIYTYTILIFFFTNTKKMQNTNDVIVFKAEIL